ncbi:hypothetical protein Vretimale_19372, partial [Volvox reticuliferus]
IILKLKHPAMFRAQPAPAEQLVTTVTQLSEGLLLVPQLLASEPQRGLLAVAEHVQRCGPNMIDTTRALARQGESAVLVAEELEEAVEAMSEHSKSAAPELARMVAQLRRATAGANILRHARTRPNNK